MAHYGRVCGNNPVRSSLFSEGFVLMANLSLVQTARAVVNLILIRYRYESDRVNKRWLLLESGAIVAIVASVQFLPSLDGRCAGQ